jgi:uncharacterized protein (DUF2126 family)
VGPATSVTRPRGSTDRLLRHLLTDLTGNTHRAEFCIDKLSVPTPSAGASACSRLRGFEMPPHERMALVQALLVRALVAILGRAVPRPSSAGDAPARPLPPARLRRRRPARGRG